MIDKNEIVSSLKQTLEKRLTTPLYGVFILSWLIFHWQFVYTMFFVSEDNILLKTYLLKNEYLIKTFFDYSELKFWLLWLAPFVLTGLVIWVFPKWISIPAFEKEEGDRVKRAKIRISKQKELEIAERGLEEENVKKLKVVTEKAKKTKEIQVLNPNLGFQNEYENFKNTAFFGQLFYIIDSIYKHNGNIAVNDMYGTEKFRIPTAALVYFHTNDLVTLDKVKGKIELTEKGKFFIKQYSAKV